MWTVRSGQLSKQQGRYGERRYKRNHTECIVVADLCSQAADQVDAVRLGAGHLGVPLPHQVDIFIDAVRLDLVEDDGVDVLAAGEDLGKRTLDVAIELLALLGAVDEAGDGSAAGGLGGVDLGLAFFPYNAVGGK